MSVEKTAEPGVNFGLTLQRPSDQLERAKVPPPGSVLPRQKDPPHWPQGKASPIY
jgi:hypothetical protein